MFHAAVILRLSCIKITSPSSNYFCLQFDQTRKWWLRCANGLQTCSVSIPAADMVKSCNFNPVWTMITTMFQEKSNTYHISKPITSRFFFQNLCHFVHFRAVSDWFIQLCNETLQHFARSWRLFRSVMWSILVPFLSLLSLLSFFPFFLDLKKIVVKFLIKQLFYSGLLDIYLNIWIIIYHSISSAPS